MHRYGTVLKDQDININGEKIKIILLNKVIINYIIKMFRIFNLIYALLNVNFTHTSKYLLEFAQHNYKLK